MNAKVHYNEDFQVEWFTVNDKIPRMRFEMEGGTAVLTNIMAEEYDGEVYGFEITRAMDYAEGLPFVQTTTIKREEE